MTSTIKFSNKNLQRLLPLQVLASTPISIIAPIKITLGNVDDRKPIAFLCRKLFGKVYPANG